MPITMPQITDARMTPGAMRPRGSGVVGWGSVGSRDLHVGDGDDGRALGEVVRQELQRLALRRGADDPPDLVPAERARTDGRSATQRAVVAGERGERGPALLWTVFVMEEIARHRWQSCGGLSDTPRPTPPPCCVLRRRRRGWRGWRP